MPVSEQDIAVIYKSDPDVIGLQNGLHPQLLSRFADAFKQYSAGGT